MAPPDKTVFVLWGEGSDELAAVTFVITLRAVGIPVKLVGVSGRKIRGAHGLALIPDYTLSQVGPLTHQAACVVIPCPAASLVRFSNDPRLGKFLYQAYVQRVQFLLQDLGVLASLLSLGVLPLDSTPQIAIYPAADALLGFVTALGVGLLG